MAERKRKMIELGDAFIAFPGGTGTLEEIAEVMSKVSLKHLDAPCILYNLNGYYRALQALLEQMIEKGLSSEERQEGIYFADNLEEIRRILAARDFRPAVSRICKDPLRMRKSIRRGFVVWLDAGCRALPQPRYCLS